MQIGMTIADTHASRWGASPSGRCTTRPGALHPRAPDSFHRQRTYATVYMTSHRPAIIVHQTHMQYSGIRKQAASDYGTIDISRQRVRGQLDRGRPGW